MTQTCQACTDPAQQCMFRDRNYIEPCPHGTYMPTDNTASLMCLPCPAGFSCHQKGARVACAAKEYSMAGEIHCHKCPAGARCPDKLGFIMCTEGQYSDYGEDTCQACPLGHYCPETHQTKQPCPPGTHQDGTSQTACKPCALGYYSDSYASTTCTQCPAGSYCPSADKPPIICPFGTYSTLGSTICLRCTDGYKCEAGETSPTPVGKTCANGFICNPARELIGLHHNIPCPAGYKYLLNSGSSRLTACTDCPAGSYCPAGTENAIACLPGYYCPVNTKYATEYPCPRGTYNTAPSGTSIGSCTTCPIAKYCPPGTATPLDCPPGSYCVAGTADPLQSKCPGGTYSGDVAIGSSAACTACPKGHYCPVGSVYPIPCPPGTVNPNLNKAYIYDCILPLAGSKATTWGNQNAAGDPCLAGHYCPVGSFGAPFPCPAGTFTDATDKVKAADCSPCTAGFA